MFYLIITALFRDNVDGFRRSSLTDVVESTHTEGIHLGSERYILTYVLFVLKNNWNKPP